MKQPTIPVHYGRGQTVVGEAVVFWTQKGICALRLLGGRDMAAVVKEIQQQYPSWQLQERAADARARFQQVEGWLAGTVQPKQLALDLHGTAFQQHVWRTMLLVPHGRTWTYSELARRAGKPRAIRAVANACGSNPVGLLVPCHRIVRLDGSLGGYGWGLEMKQHLLAHEDRLARAAKP
jgi:AraC family transcriptional regulator of adaptative response/methylated-DNA-[protein]-cysteine methyltransferase